MSSTRTKKRPDVKSMSYGFSLTGFVRFALFALTLVLLFGRNVGQESKASFVQPFNNGLLPYKFPEINATNSYVQLAPEFPEWMVEDITPIAKECKIKEHGARPGRICKMNGKKTFEKYSKEKHNYDLPAVFNGIFVSHNIGVVTPKIRHVADSNKILFSAEEVDGFEMASNWYNKNISRKALRTTVIQKLGEDAIPELTVASTFISDLTKLENWGSSNYGLTLVDVDNSNLRFFPKSIADFLGVAKLSLKFTRNHKGPEKVMNVNAGIPLSLNDIITMKKIYEDMQTKPIIKLHPSVDMSDEVYQDLLKLYIKACDITIAEHDKRDPSDADDSNKKLLLESLDKADAERQQQIMFNLLALRNKRNQPNIVSVDSSSSSTAEPVVVEVITGMEGYAKQSSFGVITSNRNSDTIKLADNSVTTQREQLNYTYALTAGVIVNLTLAAALVLCIRSRSRQSGMRRGLMHNTLFSHSRKLDENTVISTVLNRGLEL